jgi:hypothetical protein
MVAAVLLALGASAAVHADTLWVEPDNVYWSEGRGISSPLLVQEDPTASNGAYIEVEAGFNSQAAMPAIEGVASYPFTVEADGTYRIWARVMAPNTGADSFWVQVDGGTPIKWNGIAPGASWHWTLVKNEGAAAPASFALSAGQHQLKIAYREDGTRLDVLVITSDAAYDPTAPLTGPPAIPTLQLSGNSTGVLASWTAVPGAQSYTVLVDGVAVAQGLTRQTYSSPTGGCFEVLAVASTGTSDPTPYCNNIFTDPIVERKYVSSDMSSITAPMIDGEAGLVAVPGTPNSLDVAPAHGRGRFDFRLGGRAKFKVWVSTGVIDKAHDSFWVRMDSGRWIKWNNIKNTTCEAVHDSDNDDRVVLFDLGAGSHRLEFAYREVGTSMWKIALTDDLDFDIPCHD